LDLLHGFRARDPPGRGAAGWAVQATRAVAGWAMPNSARSQFPIKKKISFSNLFCKLQINLNSNQI
jgi:hypothetical protein